MNTAPSIPLSATHWLVAYFTRTASFTEKDKLDQWVCEHDDNMEIFESCLELALRPITPDPDHSEEESEIFGLAELIHHRQLGIATASEKELLSSWLHSLPNGDYILQMVPRTNNLETIYRWLVTQLIPGFSKPTAF